MLENGAQQEDTPFQKVKSGM